MAEPQPRLSATSLAVLKMIAAGRTYEQILASYPDITYLDIFRAAQEAVALALNETKEGGQAYTVAEKRERYPRAYETWIDERISTERTSTFPTHNGTHR